MNAEQINEKLLEFLTECMQISSSGNPEEALKKLDLAIDKVLRDMLDCQSPSSEELGIYYEDGV